ncbi:methylation-associated defense system protein kinase MAD6 [Desulfoferrobacter suflitae]|uniref:methylation-associated defense system protein kinase MAD6 n=1 Tax=Desulfoferrobacter suflitae TaxID=2865782 RepID=UPI002869A149|nr:protein kinase [Desulfoferrobacter suflitae]
MARLILPPHGSGPVNEGEQRAIQFLVENLPPLPPMPKMDGFKGGVNEYVVIPNIEIPDTGAHRFLEIDAIIIAPHAVYVVEIKDWGPRIEGNDHFWYLNGKRERKNPHRTLNYKCQVLRTLMGQAGADLYTKVWYQGVVVIARENVFLDLQGNCEFTSYALDSSLSSYLKDPLRLSTPKKVAEDQIALFQKDLVEAIVGKGQAHSDGPKIIEGYRVEETLHIQEGLIEYLGRSIHGHGKGPLKRLRVFTLPLYKSPEEKKLLEERIMRDFEALETIGSHPNIVSLKGFHEHEADQLVEVLDWAEEGTLRMVMSKGTLTLDQKLGIVQGIAQGLQAAHGKGIVHRDLRPENVLMAASGPKIMNFDRAYMVEGKYHTVWSARSANLDRRYLPPELALPAGQYDVYDASDLYSLGAIFYELLCGDVPYDSPESFEAAGGVLSGDKLPSKAVAGLPEWIDELISKLYAADVKNRYEDAECFLKDFYLKQAPSPASLSPSALPEPSPKVNELTDPNRIFQVGERIGDYRITRHIKSGGFAQVYQATHVLHDKDYALKVNNQSVPLDALIDEFRYLNELVHPNIVKVHWSGRLPGGRYYIAMEYLEGESLGEYAWGQKKMAIPQVIDLAKNILGALRYLHEGELRSGVLGGKPLYHRDIKPNNIIWVPERSFVLIDFNIAKEARQCRTFVGTWPYIAPDLIEGPKINWNDSGDTFALGVTLYELVCKKHPYPNGEPRTDASPIHPWDIAGCEDFSEPFVEFLFKAVQPIMDARFKTANEMEDALELISHGPFYNLRHPEKMPQTFELTQEEKGLKNYNPFVKRLRRLFSQAKFSNAGTRGLDEVAQHTYIPTRLDEELIPAILHGNYRLVIITGNAGDGKTAFIQQLEAQAKGVEVLPSKNGSRFSIGGIPFESNYDGSQDEGDIKNDEVLSRFLRIFAGLKDFSLTQEGRILAINEGRLMEFMGEPDRATQYGHLYEVIDQYFNERGDVQLPAGMILVNLNWRSVVAGDSETPSILEKQLRAFLKEEFWASCKSCDHASECFVHYNSMSFGDPAAGSEIRARLGKIFEAVHLRRQLHITMRDLRSALSFLICRDCGCEDIPKLLNKIGNDVERLNYIGHSYWNITEEANDTGALDRLVGLLRTIDVGRVAQPGVDRDLHFLPLDEMPVLVMENHRHDFPHQVLEQMHAAMREGIPAERDEETLALIKRHHALAVRKFFFEGRSQETHKRLPYRHISWFVEVIAGSSEKATEKARTTIIEAVSLGEGCRNKDLARNNICVAATNEKDPRWTSLRLFPENDFEIHVPKLGGLANYLEHTQDRFILRHKHRKEVSLEVNLDLFELLTYVAQGFTPSLNDLYGRYIELIIFKNTLQHLPYRSVVITEDHRKFYSIKATDKNQLVLEKV